MAVLGEGVREEDPDRVVLDRTSGEANDSASAPRYCKDDNARKIVSWYRRIDIRSEGLLPESSIHY